MLSLRVDLFRFAAITYSILFSEPFLQVHDMEQETRGTENKILFFCRSTPYTLPFLLFKLLKAFSEKEKYVSLNEQWFF